jgi:hypothetical protein
MKTNEQYKRDIIKAGRKAVEHLIKVAEQEIITGGEDELSADRMKNAAATKKLAIMDAFDILTRIQQEEDILNAPMASNETHGQGFAERRSK